LAGGGRDDSRGRYAGSHFTVTAEA
jgi:hypothetical protein